MKTVYDLVCPLGQFCGVAFYCRRFFLRSMSQPFDWINGTEVDLVRYVETVENDFASFCRKDALSYLMSGDDAVVYRDAGTGLVLSHDFKTNTTFDDAYPRVRAKYDRRIARFYAKIRESKNVLFIHIAKTAIPSDATILDCAARLKTKFPGTNVHLLVLAETPEIKDKPRMEEPSPGVFIARGDFYPNPKDFRLGDIAMCSQVFSLVRLRGRLRNWLHQRLGKTKFRLATMFHLTSAGRRAARQQYFFDHTPGGE